MTMPAEERLGLDLKRAEQELMAAKHAAVKPLTVPQYAALFALATTPGASSAALARACLVTPQAMTVVLRNLVEHGYVARTPHPVHAHVLETHLTAAGRHVLADADAAAVAVERRIADAFTAAERDALRALLARFADAAASAKPRAGRTNR
jgi:DNA-binding MarR family transcriptional regulator